MSSALARGRLLLAVAALLAVASVAAPSLANPPSNTREELICRAQSGVGFSYYWGGGCWCASGCSPDFSCSPGSCSGNCPSCTHSGTYGADCSGFVTKVWQVPSAIAVNSCGHGPYVAASYTSSSSYWSVIDRSSAEAGDAMAYSGHVLIYESGDPWGYMWAYEASGCAVGIVHNNRSCSNSYNAARRINISSGECSPGETDSQDCGKEKHPGFDIDVICKPAQPEFHTKICNRESDQVGQDRPSCKLC